MCLNLSSLPEIISLGPSAFLTSDFLTVKQKIQHFLFYIKIIKSIKYVCVGGKGVLKIVLFIEFYIIMNFLWIILIKKSSVTKKHKVDLFIAERLDI